jgi:hypothetical protein
VCSKVFVECKIWFGSSKRFLLPLLFSLRHSLPKHLNFTLRSWRELALRVSGTLTLWAHETLHILVAVISQDKEL